MGSFCSLVSKRENNEERPKAGMDFCYDGGVFMEPCVAPIMPIYPMMPFVEPMIYPPMMYPIYDNRPDVVVVDRRGQRTPQQPVEYMMVDPTDKEGKRLIRVDPSRIRTEENAGGDLAVVGGSDRTQPQPHNPADQIAATAEYPNRQIPSPFCREMEWMQKAIAEAKIGVGKGDGGPFGALVLRDGEIIACSHNMVLSTNDPTAHAEVTAIRAAAAKLKKFDLSDCVLYTSCYPCPMCLGAVLWSGIKEVFYAATSEDAESVGFGDKIYHQFVQNPSEGNLCKLTELSTVDKMSPFEQWEVKEDKIHY